MTDKNASIKKARESRSLKKRRDVENAFSELRKNNEVITFKSVAVLAGVSRQFLYNNFKDAITKEREKSREVIHAIDGVKVPSRTNEEFRHIEALLRNKLNRTKAELTKVRNELATMRQLLERERGKSEHFRLLWLKKKSLD